MPWCQSVNICLPSQVTGPYLWIRLGDGDKVFTRRDPYTPVLGGYEGSTQDQLPPIITGIFHMETDINPFLLKATGPVYRGSRWFLPWPIRNIGSSSSELHVEIFNATPSFVPKASEMGLDSLVHRGYFDER